MKKSVYIVVDRENHGRVFVASSPDEARSIALGWGGEFDDGEDLAVEMTVAPDLDAWADEHEIGTEVPLLVLRPHGWGESGDSACSECGLCSCGEERYAVCGWCETCRECSSEDPVEGRHDPEAGDVACEECGRWSR